jgi:hypothetical protein
MASKFQTKIKNHFVRKGFTVLSVIKLSANGYPDLLCMKAGSPDIWIESKEENDNLKELQRLRIYELNKMGKISFCLQKGKGVIYGSEMFKKDFELW